MADGPCYTKRARRDNSPVSDFQSAGVSFDLFTQCYGKQGSDFLEWVSDFVSTHKNETFDLENPAGATWTVGDLEDTMYCGQEDELNAWRRFYLPQVVSMQVVGLVEGTSCPSDQLVLMTCEDRKLYAFDGEELHMVALSLRQLHYKGINYPASVRYYEGEAFKHVAEEDWAKVREKLDQQHHDLVVSEKSEFLENLKSIKQNIELGMVCRSLNCERRLENHHHTKHHSTQKGPKPGSNQEPFCCVESMTSAPYVKTCNNTHNSCLRVYSGSQTLPQSQTEHLSTRTLTGALWRGA